jgi:hypothetical protein
VVFIRFIFRKKVHLFEKSLSQLKTTETMNHNEKTDEDDDGIESTDQQSIMSQDVAHGSNASFISKPKMVRV